MKRNNKKGFTIVELVIVIAVIGILAGVLIPTFTNVTKDAKETAALQEARNAYTEYYIDHAEAEVKYVKVGDTVYDAEDGFKTTTTATLDGCHVYVDGKATLYINCTGTDGDDTDALCDVCDATIPAQTGAGENGES